MLLTAQYLANRIILRDGGGKLRGMILPPRWYEKRIRLTVHGSAGPINLPCLSGKEVTDTLRDLGFRLCAEDDRKLDSLGPVREWGFPYPTS